VIDGTHAFFVEAVVEVAVGVHHGALTFWRRVRPRPVVLILFFVIIVHHGHIHKVNIVKVWKTDIVAPNDATGFTVLVSVGVGADVAASIVAAAL